MSKGDRFNETLGHMTKSDKIAFCPGVLSHSFTLSVHTDVKPSRLYASLFNLHILVPHNIFSRIYACCPYFSFLIQINSIYMSHH